jgi:hypothetical protein
MSGRNLGVLTSQAASEYIQLQYTASSVTQALFVAPYPCVVTDIRGRPRVAGSGGACSFQFWKAASAVAAASGTLLHSGTFDLVGTADTNQTLTLVNNSASLMLATGDSINVVLTGTPTSAVGTVNITIEPLNA